MATQACFSNNGTALVGQKPPCKRYRRRIAAQTLGGVLQYRAPLRRCCAADVLEQEVAAPCKLLQFQTSFLEREQATPLLPRDQEELLLRQYRLTQQQLHLQQFQRPPPAPAAPPAPPQLRMQQEEKAASSSNSQHVGQSSAAHTSTAQEQPSCTRQHAQQNQHAQPTPPSTSVQHQQQQEAQHPKRTVKLRALHASSTRDGIMQSASLVQRNLRRGRDVLLSSGSTSQLSNAVKALAAARTLMLAQRQGSLAFQPSMKGSSRGGSNGGSNASSSGSGASSTRTAGMGPSNSSSSNGSRGSSNASSSTPMLHAFSVDEGQLRRYNQQPLIAPRRGEPSRLANAVYARLLQQGHTTVHALGLDAFRTAMRGLLRARGQLRSWGMDLVVVPTLQTVERRAADPATVRGDAVQFVEYDDEGDVESEEEEEEDRCMQLLAFYVVRCDPSCPPVLQPWPVPAELQPRALQEQRQQKQQQQRQEAERARTVAKEASAAAVGACSGVPGASMPHGSNTKAPIDARAPREWQQRQPPAERVRSTAASAQWQHLPAAMPSHATVGV